MITKMKRFLVCTVASNKERGTYLRADELWTPMVKGYLASCGWLNGSGWEAFIENAAVGEAFVFAGMISLTRLSDDEAALVRKGSL